MMYLLAFIAGFMFFGGLHIAIDHFLNKREDKKRRKRLADQFKTTERYRRGIY